MKMETVTSSMLPVVRLIHILAWETETFSALTESDDGDLAHSLLSGRIEGADDWMWGKPLGYGGDPDFASSG